MYNLRNEAIMYIDNDEFGGWMQKLYAKLEELCKDVRDVYKRQLLNTEIRLIEWRIKYPEQLQQRINKQPLSPLSVSYTHLL